MSITTTITVHTTDDVQSAATCHYLRRAELDFTVVPAREHSVHVVGSNGNTTTWTGFRPELLQRVVEDRRGEVA